MNLESRDPEETPPVIWLHRAAGAGIGIAVMELLAWLEGENVARIPFVTSIVLVMALPRAEAARPAAVIGGHLLSSLVGVLVLWVLGANELATVAGVSLATLLMVATRLVHPPAGIDAFLIPAFALPASWVVKPVLIGAVLLALFAELWSRAEDLVWQRLQRSPDDESRSD
jgi:CBS-domain-containing membrane protein